MEGCLLARKNILIEKEFPNGYLCGEKDHVTLQYRSSRGFPTLDEAKQVVSGFSNPENFFYVQFRKSWYPVYCITNAVVIVVGKSFFCYDDMYQMCLLAFLELDHLERKERVKKLKEDIQKNG